MRALGLLASVFWTLACESGPAVAPAPPPSARAQAPAPAPDTPAREERIAADDGVLLVATLHLAGQGAPAVLLVHSQETDRKEWDPLVQRLVKAGKRFNVFSYDRRGHGASPGPAPSSPDAAIERHTKDLQAALAHLERVAAPKTIVLVGSSFGAALAASVVESSPKVSGLALISPGQAVMGLDLYKPFARIRNVPSFVAGCAEDAVSRQPLEVLGKMSLAGTQKTYAGKAHTARLVGSAQPALWSDLETWLLGVFDAPPRPPPVLDHMPGKAPATSLAEQRRAGARSRAGGSR